MLHLQNIDKSYQTTQGPLAVLKDLSLHVKGGEALSITGASGSGKSTLLNIIGLIEPYEGGSYTFDGVNPSSLSRHQQANLRNTYLGYVFQEYALLESESIFENVRIPLIYRGISKRKQRVQVEEILELLQIHEKIDIQARLLSGGQRQRVALARALVHAPQIILADEPTSSLDPDTSTWVSETLRNYQQESRDRILIMVTHETKRPTERVVHLHNGSLNEERTL